MPRARVKSLLCVSPGRPGEIGILGDRVHVEILVGILYRGFARCYIAEKKEGKAPTPFLWDFPEQPGASTDLNTRSLIGKGAAQGRVTPVLALGCCVGRHKIGAACARGREAKRTGEG